MIILISTILCISILLSPLAVLANDCPTATPIFQGETAPCDGVILPEAKVKEYFNLKMATKTLQDKLDLEKSLREREMEVCRKKIKTADNWISDRKNPPWWQSTKFNRWLGFAGGVVVSAAAFWAFR